MKLITFSYEVTDYDVVSDVYGDTISRTPRAIPCRLSYAVVVPEDNEYWRGAARRYLRRWHITDAAFSILSENVTAVNAILTEQTRL